MADAEARAVVTVALPRDVVDDLRTRMPGYDVVYDADLVAPYDSDALDPAGRSSRSRDTFRALVDSADVLLGIPDHSPVELAATLRRNPNLRWVHTVAAGGGAQVGAAALRRADLDRVVFTTSAGVHAGPLAEFAVTGVLLGLKQIPRMIDAQREQRWEPRRPLGILDGSTVTVVGLGHVGRRIARTLDALGATVVGVHRGSGDGVVSRSFSPDRLGVALAASEAVILALPDTAATRSLLDADALAQAAPGIVVVNVGRGSTVDEPALIDALRSGRVGAAVLDVVATEPLPKAHPLWNLPNVVISPHTAALAADEPAAVAQLFADNANRLRRGEELRNRVNTEEFY